VTATSLAAILRFVLAERGWSSAPGVEALAAWLPAVACAGMEVPLRGDGPVDLQQRIRSASEVDRLTRHLQRLTGSDHLPPDSAWRRLPALCRSQLVNGHFEDLWLELDNTDRAGTPPVSIFGRMPAALPRASRASAIEGVLAACGVDSSAAQRAALARCLEACPPEGRPSHLGVMLGRPGTPVRLVFDGIDRDGFSAFLARAGFPGSAAAAQRCADALFANVDRIRLALTLGECLEPVLGLECFVGRPGESDPRWRCALDLLVRKRLCSRELRDRLVAWPAVLTPDTATGDWPHALVMDALARSPREIGWLECRISHVKVTLAGDRPRSAKAYFGFVEAWADVTSEAPATAVAGSPRPRAAGFEEAIASALDFLLSARTQAGWWLDYDGFQEGVSDEWVTAYVAHAMDESGDSRAADAARRAWALLARRKRPGWGWNGLQPADADSTTWALRLAARLGALDSEPARAGLAFLHLHFLPGGGVATYRPDRQDGRPPGAEINPNWYAAHPCVTAAAAAVFPPGAGPLRFLRRAQQPDGCWTGYWWKSPAYATVHAAEALADRGTAANGAPVTRAVRWAERRLDTTAPPAERDASPFVTALELRLLLLSPEPHRELVATTTRRLLAAQHADGSWDASAVLAIPNSSGQEVPALDHRRIFTTATVLCTLHRLRSLPPVLADDLATARPEKTRGHP
jgi:hypothetical protein